MYGSWLPQFSCFQIPVLFCGIIAHVPGRGYSVEFFFFLTNNRWVSMYVFKSYQWEGGLVASWLVRSSSDRAVRVQALAGDIVVFLGKTLYSRSASLHPGV